jgi:hypothetical protein
MIISGVNTGASFYLGGEEGLREDEATARVASLRFSPIQSEAASAYGSCKSLLKAGDIAGAISTIRATQNCYERSCGMRKILKALVKLDRIDEAMKLSSDAIDQDKVRALNTIFNVLVETNKVDKALEVALVMEHPYWKEYALAHMAELFAQAGRIAEALEIAKKIPRDSDRFKDIMETIATLLSEKAWIDPENINLMLIDTTVQLALSITEERVLKDCLVSIPLALAGLGKMDEAIEMAWSLGGTYCDESLRRIRLALVARKDMESASKIAQYMIQDSLRESVLI